MDAVQRWLTLVTLVSAALAGLLYLARQTWRAFRVMERLSDVVQHELSPNTGSSMKDDVAAIAVAVGQLQLQGRQLQSDMADIKSDYMSRPAADAAHAALQLQLDSIHHDIGQHQAGQHRREDETR